MPVTLDLGKRSGADEDALMDAVERLKDQLAVEVKKLEDKIFRMNMDFESKVREKIDEMYHEKMKDKATLTHLFGLNKTIEKRENDDKLPTFPKEL